MADLYNAADKDAKKMYDYGDVQELKKRTLARGTKQRRNR